MPPEPRTPDNPDEWLRRAKSNLARARIAAPNPEICFEDLCFDAQQAVEKAIKALLIQQQVDFPYTHNLSRLISLVEQAGIPAPEYVKSAESLTRYATAMRYPGLDEPVTEEEFLEALTLAEKVVQWTETLLL